MWCGLPNATILWLLLSPLGLGGSFSMNPLISPKDLFEVTQVTQGGSRTQLVVALSDLLTAVSWEEKTATRVWNTGVCSLIPRLCGEEGLGGLLTFATLYERQILWAAVPSFCREHFKDPHFLLCSLSLEPTLPQKTLVSRRSSEPSGTSLGGSRLTRPIL